MGDCEGVVGELVGLGLGSCVGTVVEICVGFDVGQGVPMELSE